MDPQEELEKAKARVNSRIVFHRHIWRWIWNRCPECGNKMLVHEYQDRRVRVCAVYPGHKPYATGVNTVFSLWVIIGILLMIIAIQTYKMPHASRQRPPVFPKDGQIVPPIQEWKGDTP